MVMRAAPGRKPPARQAAQYLRLTRFQSLALGLLFGGLVTTFFSHRGRTPTYPGRPKDPPHVRRMGVLNPGGSNTQGRLQSNAPFVRIPIHDARDEALIDRLVRGEDSKVAGKSLTADVVLPRVAHRGTASGHTYDAALADALVTLFRKPVSERPGHRKGSSVAEFGAGDGRYAKHFRENGISRVFAYDSAPDVERETAGRVQHYALGDKSTTVDSAAWVLCIDSLQKVDYLEGAASLGALVKHAGWGLVISTALQRGDDPSWVNEKGNGAYAITALADVGFTHDPESEAILRKAATLPWLQEGLMVFTRKSRIGQTVS